jgi:hypothetical protein
VVVVVAGGVVVVVVVAGGTVVVVVVGGVVVVVVVAGDVVVVVVVAGGVVVVVIVAGGAVVVVAGLVVVTGAILVGGANLVVPAPGAVTSDAVVVLGVTVGVSGNIDSSLWQEVKIRVANATNKDITILKRGFRFFNCIIVKLIGLYLPQSLHYITLNQILLIKTKDC